MNYKTVLCDYCQKPAELITGKELYPHRPSLYRLNFWRCKPCAAYVGCHKPGVGQGDGSKPLGRLANANLRAAKSQVHHSLDYWWTTGLLTRTEVYTRLAHLMELPLEQCHIGMLNEQQCAEALSYSFQRKLWLPD